MLFHSIISIAHSEKDYIQHYSVDCYYQHITIGVAGVNQLQRIVEKNDRDQIFTDHSNVLCIVDGDVFSSLKSDYKGPTQIICSPVEDIEMYICSKRSTLLPNIDFPPYRESCDKKRASKTYWRWLLKDKGFRKNDLYQLIVGAEDENVQQLLEKVRGFLKKSG